ncbi:MAG: RHS repeat-associated core domain-containing protein [Nitrospirales bacterium]|nr:RHS repeat-associated core domain-containing protein [Nitrospirales bacterium]
MLTNGSGVKEQDPVYYPYGETYTNTGTANAAYKYTAKELDDSTGLYFYETRYYDAVIGRFILADRIVPDSNDPQTLNRYTYVENNPIKYVDPDGQVAQWAIQAAIGAVAGASGAYGAALANGADAISLQAGLSLTAGLLTGGVTGAFLPHLATQVGTVSGQSIALLAGFTSNIVSQGLVQFGLHGQVSNLDFYAAAYSGAFAPLAVFAGAQVGGRILVGTASRFSVGETGAASVVFVSPTSRIFAGMGEAAFSGAFQSLGEVTGFTASQIFRIPTLNFSSFSSPFGSVGLFGTSLMATHSFPSSNFNINTTSSFGVGSFGFQSLNLPSSSLEIQSFDLTSQFDNFDIRSGFDFGVPSGYPFINLNSDSRDFPLPFFTSDPRFGF